MKTSRTPKTAVGRWQERLNQMTGSNLTIDDKWGPKTQAAYDKYLKMQQQGPGLQWDDDAYNQVPIREESFAGYLQPDFWGNTRQDSALKTQVQAENALDILMPGHNSNPYYSGDLGGLRRNGPMPDHYPLQNTYLQDSIDRYAERGAQPQPGVGTDHQFRGQWEVPHIPNSSHNGGDHKFYGEWETPPQMAYGGPTQDRPKPTRRPQVNAEGFNDRYSGSQYYEWKKRQQAQQQSPQVTPNMRGAIFEASEDEASMNVPIEQLRYPSDSPRMNGTQYYQWKREQEAQQRDQQLLDMYGREYYLNKRKNLKNRPAGVIEKDDLSNWSVLDNKPRYDLGGGYNPAVFVGPTASVLGQAFENMNNRRNDTAMRRMMGSTDFQHQPTAPDSQYGDYLVNPGIGQNFRPNLGWAQNPGSGVQLFT